MRVVVFFFQLTLAEGQGGYYEITEQRLRTQPLIVQLKELDICWKSDLGCTCSMHARVFCFVLQLEGRERVEVGQKKPDKNSSNSSATVHRVSHSLTGMLVLLCVLHTGILS